MCAVACSGNDESKTCEHDYAETVVAATCTEGGYTEHRCSKCDDVYKDNEVAALGHDMTDWAEKTAATCTAAQVMEKHCKRTGCTEAETKNGEAALGHDMQWTTTLEPTCTADGTKDGACQRDGCDHTETGVKIDKLGHHYVESTDDEKAKAATCTKDGLKVEICDRKGCGDRKETTLIAFGHTDDGTKEEVTAPTCTEQGYTTRHCATCNEDYQDTYKDALGHEMALTETVDVSCLTDGYELWECRRDNCDFSEKREEKAKLDHKFDDDGNCTSGCGKSINNKITWVNTKYDVTYTETTDRLTLIGGDPCGEGSIAPGSETNYKSITIPAAVLAAKKAAGLSTFTVTVYRLEGTTPQFGFCYDESTFEYSANNVPHYTSKVITIDDEMLQNGFKFLASYTDLTQRNPDWGGTKVCEGFDFDIEFIKAFDINDKSMWVRSEFASTAYSTEKGKWTITDAAPGANDVKNNITISADVFKAMSETYGSFKLVFTTKDDGTAPIFGFKEVDEDWTKYKYGTNAYTSAEKTITDDMLANGYSFTLLYADANKRDGGNPEAPDVTGFDMDIEFFTTITLNADNKTYTYDEVVGYGEAVAEFNVSSITDNGTGGTYFMVGSYGVYYRAGEFRLATLTNGSYGEYSPRTKPASFDRNEFNKGVILGINVTDNENGKVTIFIYVNDNLLGSETIAKVSDEIASAEAKASVNIVTPEVTKCVLIK